MNLLLSYIVLLFGVCLSSILFWFAIRLLRVDKFEGEKNAARARTIKDALLGRARTRDDWMPDARVKAGMIFNRGEQRLEVSGRLSNDSFNRAFD